MIRLYAYVMICLCYDSFMIRVYVMIRLYAYVMIRVYVMSREGLILMLTH
jgi:hypothetical protein